MNWTSYLLQVNLYLVLFYTFYWLFLKRETFFKLNRIYLVGSAFFSALIPLMKTEFMQSFFITKEVQQNWTNLNIIVTEGFAGPLKEDSHWALGDYLTLIYCVMVSILLFRLIYRLIQVSRLLKINESFESFSFFKKIRISKDLPQQEIIEKHEMAHAKEFHSADVIFFELLSIINWFNPVVYFYKRSVKHIHEFIADRHALENQIDKSEYAMLLFSKSFGVNPHSLTNTFFNQSILKKRIEMMNKKQSKRTAIVKYSLSVPLFLLAMILSSAKISDNKSLNKLSDEVQPSKTISDIFFPSTTGNEPTDDESLTEFEELNIYLVKTLKYPKVAKDNKEMARVILKFTLGQDHKINNLEYLGSISTAFTNEALRSMKTFDKVIDAKPGKYFYYLDFLIKGAKIPKEFTGKFPKIKNLAGEILISAHPQTDEIYLLKNVTFQNDRTNQDTTGTPIFKKVEVYPSFPEGYKAFGEFLGNNINYPEEARKNNIQGKVLCSFVVEKDGTLSNIKVLKGIGSGCNEEAVRLLSLSPKWIPGKQDGKAVRVSFSIPIQFALKAKGNKVGAINSSKKAQEIFSLEKSDNASLKLIDHTNGNMLTSNKIVFNSKEVPLIYLDGKKIDQEKLNSIDTNTIESINVLKKGPLTEKYGNKGKNGVLIITTKEK
ncbi:MAG: TonB family protein [Pelobium sp.]